MTYQNGKCICEGNWRELIKECDSLFDRIYKTENGVYYTFIGIIWGSDDFYYCMMSGDGKIRRLSCVGSIEGYGLTLQSLESI